MEPPRRAPLGPGRDVGQLALEPDIHLARRRAQDRRGRSLVAEQPGRPHQRVPGQRQLRPGRVDPHLAALAVIDVHGLGEAELVRDRLALLLGYGRALEEDPQRVAARAVGQAEDPHHLKAGVLAGREVHG